MIHRRSARPHTSSQLLSLQGFLIVMVLTMLGLTTQYVLAQWVQCIPATIGDMQSLTLKSAPDGITPPTRTTIGIGEKVLCYLVPSTWHDLDYHVPTGITNFDTIGDRVWVSSGAGTVTPNGVTQSYTTTLTAHKSPESVNVLVRVYDSKTQYHDDYIDKSITFDVIAPNSQTYTKDVDYNPAGWVNWTDGVKYLGTATDFEALLHPLTVCFGTGVEFQEDLGNQTDTWPDGITQWNAPSGLWPFFPNDSNKWPDSQISGLFNLAKLFDGAWHDFKPEFDIPLQYKNQDGNWVTFHTARAGREYYHATAQTRSTVGGEVGGLRGPYQRPE